jgi:hypothetical protein
MRIKITFALAMNWSAGLRTGASHARGFAIAPGRRPALQLRWTLRSCFGPLLCLLVFTACGKKDAGSTDTSARETAQPTEAASPSPGPNAPAVESSDARQTLAEADKFLRVGSYDEAAARLLKMRISAAKFSGKDAEAYRNALQQTYSRALEAANKGDPKGKAALEMIRATRAR